MSDPLKGAHVERRDHGVRQARPARPGQQFDDDRPEDLLELDVEKGPASGRRQHIRQGRDAQRLEGDRRQGVDPI
jgi:hypothetical protein